MGARELPARVRFLDSVSIRLGSERGFLFEQRSGHVFSLNGSATLAAAGFRDGIPTADVIASVVEAFDVDAATVRADLARLVAQLLEEGLVESHG
jgi:Coenzyme PQQ synthesis protein D (PqqD)